MRTALAILAALALPGCSTTVVLRGTSHVYHQKVSTKGRLDNSPRGNTDTVAAEKTIDTNLDTKE